MFSRIAYGLSALLIGVSALAGIQFSSAEWTGSSRTPMGISAARDWTPPMIALDEVDFYVIGTVDIGATAADALTGIASVTIQYAPSGTSSWTTLCADTVAPYSCSWDTTLVADASYDLRATATDVDGNSATSDVVTTEVVNNVPPSVLLAPVPSPVRGSIDLQAQVVNVDRSATYTFRYSSNGGSNYTDIGTCSAITATTCTVDTALLPDGVYALQVEGKVGKKKYTASQTGITVDNTAPSVSLTAPAGPWSGTVELAATATDATSGVASVLFEHRLGSGSWTSCGLDTSAPFTCTLDTSGLADGTYDVRATATDLAGNATSTATQSRLVDNTDPTVALTVPAGPLSGIVALSATASDAGSGVANVVFQHRLQGAGSWSSCGTDSSAPYTCDLNTSPLLNGTYEFRAVATDNAGRSTTTAVQTRAVQSIGINLSALPSAVKGTTTLTATWQGSASTSVTFERSVTGANNWTTICTATAAQVATCNWNPASPSVSDGTYDVRVRTTYQSTVYTHTRSVVLDRVVPTSVVLSVPAAPLNGTVALTATASDALSGIASVLFEYKLTSGSTWVACGTATTAPYSCSVDTTTLNDASYDFRATGSDAAGNTKVSLVVARTVNSAVSSVSITSPTSGDSVLGTTMVTTNATSTKAITNVVIQYKTGTGSWTNACTATASPYSCSWNTSTLAYGSYQLQAILTQANGYTVTSAAVPVAVERFRGYSIDATPGGVSGYGDNGDLFVLTYTSKVDLSTIKSGWTGTATPITAYLNDKGISGAPVTGMDFLSFGSGINLGMVSFGSGQDYVTNGRQVTFANALMTVATVTVDGRDATRITISMGNATADSNRLRSDSSTGHMVWFPSTAAKDTAGVASMSDTVTETGALDSDL